jgi:hypothetical protein
MGLMEKDVQERFERIERNLERFSEETREGMKSMRDSHLELEAAQKNTTVLLNRFIEESNKRGAEVDERIANLAILVDQLLKRDLNGNGH